MTAATQDILSQKYGPEDQVLPSLGSAGVAAATTIYGGTMVMINSSGYAVPAAASATGAPGKVVGRCERQVVNTTAAGGGAGGAGALTVLYDVGAFFYALNADSTVTIANFGAPMYASDDSTVSLYDAGGQRPLAGYFVGLPTTPGIPGLSGDPSGTTKVAVQLGVAIPWPSDAASSGSAAYKARAVITTIQPYAGGGSGTLTANTNVALSTQDGVSTLVVGDVVLLQAGTTNINAASDAGPYAISALGNASNAAWVLKRPDWWATGSIIPLAATIDVDGEGTVWSGVSWRSFAAKSTVIDTSDPKLYPGRVTVQATLVNAIVPVSTIPIFSATKVGIEAFLYSTSGTATSAVGYGTSTLPTAGELGTATFNIVSLVAGMTKNANNDNSIVNVTVINW
jgi:hypothetical protein